MFGWIVGGLIAALVVAAVRSRLRMYRRLFSHEHFLEVARAAPSLKAAAVENPVIGDSFDPTTPDDPRVLLTKAGLAVLYTVGKRESAFVHHYSVSVAGQYTARAVGATFVALLAKQIGLPLEKARFWIGNSTVHHAQVTLSEAEHATLIGFSVPEISESNVTEARRTIDEMKDRLTWIRDLS
jgi:hypothetical protein